MLTRRRSTGARVERRTRQRCSGGRESASGGVATSAGVPPRSMYAWRRKNRKVVSDARRSILQVVAAMGVLGLFYVGSGLRQAARRPSAWLGAALGHYESCAALPRSARCRPGRSSSRQAANRLDSGHRSASAQVSICQLHITGLYRLPALELDFLALNNGIRGRT